MVSCADEKLIQLELQAVLPFLWGKVIDLGCCDGMTTVEYAESPHVNSVVGLDSCDAVLAAANRRLEHQGSTKVLFEKGDVRDTGFAADTFDVAVFKRVLCNLGNWTRQAEALNEAARIARSIVIVEPFTEGEAKLNSLRNYLQLDSQLLPKMCEYPSEVAVIDHLDHHRSCHISHGFKLCHRSDPFSTYFLLTRVFNPASGRTTPETEQFNTVFHHMAADLPSWGEWSNQKLLVFNKR